MITLPKQPKIIEESENKAVLEVEACYPGYGTTLGNAIRRVLLSSLPGAAITGIKINGIQHEFSTIPYVTEDVVQIILNLKQVRFMVHTGYEPDKSFKASLKVSGEKEVKAKNIKTSSEIEIINDDLHIANLTDKKAKLEMEIEIGMGLGYSPVEMRKQGKLETGKIAIDAIFTPVRRVNYSVEHMRVGDRTDYDKIRFIIETDGTINPKEAFLKTTKLLVDQYKAMTKFGDKKSKKVEKKVSVKPKEEKEEQEEREDPSKIKVEDLKLSTRTITALTEAGIKSVAGLIRKNEEDIKDIEGLGDKGLVEIKRTLSKFGLMLK